MKYQKKMSPKWENIGKVQDRIGWLLKDRDKGFTDSIKMVAGELLENSVKYYANHNIRKRIDFNLTITDKIVISIKDQVLVDNTDVEELCRLIERINISTNVYNMFYDRLQAIFDNRKKGESKLGLLRIASEGGLNLDYKIIDNNISIYAQKAIRTGEISMEPLNYEDLKIEVVNFDTYIKVSWSGKCRALNPEHILDDYLEKLNSYATGTKLVVNFDKLESMNSSTVPPLLTFIKNLESSKIHTVFEYNIDEDWQRASFKPLAIITGKFTYVKIRPSSINKK